MAQVASMILGLVSMESTKWLLTRASCSWLHRWEVPPRIGRKKLKDALWDQLVSRQSSLPLIKEESVNGIAWLSQWWFHRKMHHVCSQMTWLLKLTKKQSASSSNFQSPWDICTNQNMKKCLGNLQYGIGLMLAKKLPVKMSNGQWRAHEKRRSHKTSGYGHGRCITTPILNWTK